MKKYSLLIIFTCWSVIGTAQTSQIGKQGVVVSASPLASQIGVAIMRSGGNAVDAAVAVGFALAVVYPEAGNIGGGGFMLIRTVDGHATVIDYREQAPGAAHAAMFLDEKSAVIPNLSTVGPLAAGIPGSVRGLELAWRKYGTLPWHKLLAPAIKLASKGYALTYYNHTGLEAVEPLMRRFPASYTMFYPNGRIPEIGTKVKYPTLASTLKRLAQKGADEFYTGKTAQEIVASVQAAGGIFTLEDLRAYKAVEREPLFCSYRNYQIISVPPPSSGGVCLAQILKILEHFPLSAWGFQASRTIQAIVEAERRAYANRATYLGDPDFVAVPIKELLQPQTISQLVNSIDLARATPSSEVDAVRFYESEETTHYSVIDKNGMAVAVTTTLNTSFGSCFVAGKTGILLNNEMDDFAIKPGHPNVYGLVGTQANAIAPHKRMLSSMTPTMVLSNDSLLYILGTPGGGTIITTLVQLIVNLTDFRMSLPQAVNAPRFHHQWLPDEIAVEPYAFTPDLVEILSDKGYKIVTRGLIGDVNAIAINYPQGFYQGVADWRRQSAAAAY